MGAPARALHIHLMLDRTVPGGYTLLEITALLILVAVATSAALPRFSRTLDRFAVLGARERVAGLLAVARARAPGLGGARVVVRESPVEVRVEAGDSVLIRLGADDLDGVEVEVAGARAEITFTYDALGVGRVASGSLGFRRGGQEARLVVSSYGRIDRR